MKKQNPISTEEARRIGESLYLDWESVDLEQFRQGLMGNPVPAIMDPDTGSTFDGILQTGKVVLAHLQEIPDYFSRLSKLESELDEFQAGKK